MCSIPNARFPRFAVDARAMPNKVLHPGQVGGQVWRYSKRVRETLGGGKGGAEFGGDLFESFLALEMRDALHAPTPIVHLIRQYSQRLPRSCIFLTIYNPQGTRAQVHDEAREERNRGRHSRGGATPLLNVVSLASAVRSK